MQTSLLYKTYRALHHMGLPLKRLLVPYYWLPYNFGRGRALPPFTVNMELTFRCNLRCQMCSLVVSNAVETGGFPMNRGMEGDDPGDLRGDELEYPEYAKLLDELKAYRVRHIGLTGGEPFIKKDAAKIVQHIRKNGFYLSIITNGTVMTDEICEALVGGCNSLTVSVDGPEAIHNEIRGSASGHQRIRKNVLKLQEWKKKKGSALPKIGFSCAVSSMNQAHLAEVVDFAGECEAQILNYGYLFFSDEATIKATDRITLTGQADFADQRIPLHLRQVDIEVIKEQLRDARRRAAAKGIELHFNPPLEEHELNARFNDPVYFFTNKCFIPWYETRMNPFGDIYSCQIDTRLGNIREQSFREIWNGAQYRDFRNLIREHDLLPKCSRCCKLNDRTWNHLPKISFARKGRMMQRPRVASPN
jgi:MoaA/NifB/PqqE/SkfB family radical SAM enzyme